MEIVISLAGFSAAILVWVVIVRRMQGWLIVRNLVGFVGAVLALFLVVAAGVIVTGWEPDATPAVAADDGPPAKAAPVVADAPAAPAVDDAPVKTAPASVADDTPAPVKNTVGIRALDTYHPISGFTPDVARAKAYCVRHWDPASEKESLDRCIEQQKAGQAYLTLYMTRHGLASKSDLVALYKQGYKPAYAVGSCISTHNPDGIETPDMHMIGWCVLNRTQEHLGGY
ncbi:MAG: hypothetical protein PF501_19155 [Salinisphaera sp.]|jgi:hypothetical protein|nr:hypothetical protein [Salinisphaera sp.]